MYNIWLCVFINDNACYDDGLFEVESIFIPIDLVFYQLSKDDWIAYAYKNDI
jgi:hypothetical protein